MIIDNEWYGHRAALLRYASRNDQPCCAFVAHSSSLIWEYQTFKFSGKLDLISPILVWTNQESISMRRLGSTNVHSIGSPFLYAYLSSKHRVCSEREGTVVFPQHLVPGEGYTESNIIIIQNLIDFTENNCEPPFIMSIPGFDPRISMINNKYRSEDWSFISFGGRNELSFLDNFIKTVARAKFVVVETSSSSAYYYSLFLSAKVLIFKHKSILDSNVCYSLAPCRKIRPEIEHLVNKSELSDDEAKLLSGVVLGVSQIRPPEELLQLLGVDSIAKSVVARVVHFITRLKYGQGAVAGNDDKKIVEIQGKVR